MRIFKELRIIALFCLSVKITCGYLLCRINNENSRFRLFYHTFSPSQPILSTSIVAYFLAFDKSFGDKWGS
ncbi:hypothetical protein KKA13_01645 [Patescibacteria group bacterium]|nr:hypothetical protein [Patescibacteria group bacterium]